nr:FkbM family methyltransferase [Synechococcus sp. HK05]
MLHSSSRVIFDIGSNNGDDIPYYLLKAERVVAVEANPALCDAIATRFSDQISSGRLIVENAALINGSEGCVDFFIHNKYHVLSSLSKTAFPDSDFAKIEVRATNIHRLVEQYGSPFYAKIDVEGADEAVLESFHESAVKPPYISAESHKLGVFALLSEKLGYQSFKLVDGRSVSTVYKHVIIPSPVRQQMVAYSFPHHSAGPFGNDIYGEWMDKATLLKVLALQGLGWRDIHASAIDRPTLSY